MIGTFAQFENDVKSERTTNGMKQAVQQGRWCWRAPIGYKQTKDSLNKSLLVPIEESRFIEEAFTMAETGMYKQTEISEHLRKKGFKKITKNLLNRILRNYLYAGIIKVDWFPDYIQAIHKPIIAKDTFFKVQLLLDGKKTSITPKLRNHSDFPLRNFIRCPKCGQKLTGGWSTGRKKVKYAYYHCRTKGCSLSVKKNELESEFFKYLSSFQPNKEILELFEEIVLNLWKSKQSERIKEQLRLEKEIKEFKEKEDKIFDYLLKGTVDAETYKQKTEEIRSDSMIKKIELNEMKIELDDIEACLNYCKFFLSNVANLWANADINLRQRFQSLIFPDKIYYEAGTFRTTATALIFKQLQSKSLHELDLVVPRGFEPLLLE
ncbi:MAG: recombinase family protein [Candidatus Omnitrophica bacterium]|nr:recombinase family protein [Candidatus Omnitrophota bacterium]